METYIGIHPGAHEPGSSQGQELPSSVLDEDSSAGLFADKKRCMLCEEDKCVLCDSEEVEDVLHILVLCEEFQWERQELLSGRRH